MPFGSSGVQCAGVRPNANGVRPLVTATVTAKGRAGADVIHARAFSLAPRGPNALRIGEGSSSAPLPFRCRGCGRTPEETGTPAADHAVAFTCARCLMAWKPEDERSGATNTTTQGSSSGVSEVGVDTRVADGKSGTSRLLGRVLRPVRSPSALETLKRGGCPRLTDAERTRRARERKRRWRDGRTTGQTPAPTEPRRPAPGGTGTFSKPEPFFGGQA